MLKGLAQKGLASEASRLFDAMDKQGVQRNVITFNTVIDAAVRARKIEEAWRLYDEMRQSPTLKPDKCTCSTLVKALQQKPTPDQIESVPVDVILVRKRSESTSGRGAEIKQISN